MRYDSYQDILTRERPLSSRCRMDTGRRAKQFAPFAALKGFEDCVHRKEILYTEKKDISEDRQAELNFRLRMLRYGEEVTACYFAGAEETEGKTGHYESLTGHVSGIEPGRCLWIEDVCIPLANLYQLQ